ncbi:sensor histidine kinase [Streptomyces sp. MUM 203J]|uniref:sensor histidine kinase n=1 Tax=Streptomyces sp. MUM 203J TaxID=2791990 RepID=UPI001F04741E|nr:sensor histidine kinase [Streptomyces sp. MUM 203J]MCH0542042.1 sensor histidine kinase [Streptomyces sp. MUM 203J]
MSSVSPPPSGPASAPGTPGTPGGSDLAVRLARRARRSTREGLHALGTALSTPTEAGAPLLGQANSLWVRLLPYVAAVALIASLLPVTVVTLVESYGLNGGIAGVLATAQTAPLLMAVTRPLQAWWIVFTADVAGAVAMMNPGGPPGADPSDNPAAMPWPWTPMVIIGYVALMVAVGLREHRRTLLSVWVVTGGVGFGFALVPGHGGENTHVVLFLLSGVTLLITGMLRERSDAQRRLVEQETISEAERARRTLLEERARIARELHDVVAHHMSVITVQADSAPYRIEGIPPAAREEFTAIAASARESLAEMRRLLSVLRSERAGGEREPQPGIDRLPHLVEATIRAGVPVQLSLAEELGRMSPAVELSAYRMVQEALANVVRHAPGARTRVSVSRSPNQEWLIVLVVNGPPTKPTSLLETSGTGLGLVGMRERVRLTGGWLDSGPLPDGGFRVAARLPLDTPP